MMRKFTIFLVLSFMGILAVYGFGSNYDKFFPFFKDVPGWKAEKPSGTDANFNGNRMLTATRIYKKGNSEITVSVLVGPQAFAYKQMLALKNMNITTSEGEHVEVKNINGFKVLLMNQKDGSFMAVFLDTKGVEKGGVLLFGGDKVNFNTLSNFSKNFDWNGIQRVYLSIFK